MTVRRIAPRGFWAAGSGARRPGFRDCPGERQIVKFINYKSGARREEEWTGAARLASIDTASWEALTLKDGKLTGIVLLIPPSPE
jgi:hypothetical protein